MDENNRFLFNMRLLNVLDLHLKNQCIIYDPKNENF